MPIGQAHEAQVTRAVFGHAAEAVPGVGGGRRRVLGAADQQVARVVAEGDAVQRVAHRVQQVVAGAVPGGVVGVDLLLEHGAVFPLHLAHQPARLVVEVLAVVVVGDPADGGLDVEHLQAAAVVVEVLAVLLLAGRRGDVERADAPHAVEGAGDARPAPGQQVDQLGATQRIAVADGQLGDSLRPPTAGVVDDPLELLVRVGHAVEEQAVGLGGAGAHARVLTQGDVQGRQQVVRHPPVLGVRGEDGVDVQLFLDGASAGVREQVLSCALHAVVVGADVEGCAEGVPVVPVDLPGVRAVVELLAGQPQHAGVPGAGVGARGAAHGRGVGHLGRDRVGRVVLELPLTGAVDGLQVELAVLVGPARPAVRRVEVQHPAFDVPGVVVKVRVGAGQRRRGSPQASASAGGGVVDGSPAPVHPSEFVVAEDLAREDARAGAAVEPPLLQHAGAGVDAFGAGAVGVLAEHAAACEVAPRRPDGAVGLGDIDPREARADGARGRRVRQSQRVPQGVRVGVGPHALAGQHLVGDPAQAVVEPLAQPALFVRVAGEVSQLVVDELLGR